MKPFLGKYSEEAYTLLRVVAGFCFACHGAQKLFGILGSQPMTQPLFITAGIIEFFGGLLILIGLFTPLVAFIASGEMAVAYFKVHAPNSFFPVKNRGELAVLFCFIYLFIATRGGGRWSVDGWWARRKTPMGV